MLSYTHALFWLAKLKFGGFSWESMGLVGMIGKTKAVFEPRTCPLSVTSHIQDLACDGNMHVPCVAYG